MGKCGGCGKFMSTTAECVRCPKCTVEFHRACVKVPESVKVSAGWVCPGCKNRQPRGDNSATPVRGLPSALAADELPPASSSDVEISATDESHNIKCRTKNMPQSTSTDSLALEIRHFREELKAAREELRTEIKEVRLEIIDFKASLKSCHERMDSMDARLLTLEKKFEEFSISCKNPTIEDTISELKGQLNDRDQELLLNDVEITGVPESRNETLLHLVKLMTAKLGVEIDDNDVVHIERSGSIRQNRTEEGGTPVPRPRPIAVRFSRRTTRDQLVRSARVRRVITTSDLGLEGTSNRLYVNERLTRTNRQLFYKTREECRGHQYKYTWTRDGKIFVRKDDGKQAERIRTEKDLTRIFH